MSDNAEIADNTDNTDNAESAEIAESAESAASAEVVEGAVAVPEAEPVVDNPERKVRRRGRIAAVAGSVLLACAVVAGVGFTVVTVRGADQDPGKPTWEFPDEEAGEAKTPQATGLRALFLPFENDGYFPGPDVAGFGNDTELGGAQATALRKESIKDLPASTRRRIEKVIDKQRIQGMAMRSYVATFGQAIGSKQTFTISVTLQRMQNRAAVRDVATSFNAFLAATDLFREAPKIKGHKDARCFLTPKGKDEEVDGAFCSAYVGDILVSATAYGPSPLDGDNVTEFLAAQLDRIDAPGQSV